MNKNINNKSKIKNKQRKTLYKTVFRHFALFALGIFVAIFLMQVIFLKPMYKNIRKNEVKTLAETIEKEFLNDNLLINNPSNLQSEIDRIAYNSQVQVYIYKNDSAYYMSEGNSGRMPQSLNNEIKKILNIFKEEDSKNEYTTNIDLKKFSSTVNIYIRQANIVQDADILNDFKVIIVSPVDQIDSTIEVLTIQNLYLSVFAVLTAILISTVLSKNISSPIEKITDKAKLLEEGKYDLDIPKTRYVETENLRNVLSTSSNKLKERDVFQKNIIANVSHDLKTPLAIIKAYTEKIQDITGDDKAKRNEDLQIISKETESLSLLISDMLDLSKLDAGDYVLNIEEFNVVEVLETTINRLDIIKEKKNINIVINKDKEIEKIRMSGDKVKIGQVIYNLITNAIKYSDSNSKVNVNLVKTKNQLRVEVQDFGKGILKEELSHIFDKHYKSNDKSRKEDSLSSGLGLSIVKSILEKHNLKYGVESEKDEGTTFWFNVEIKDN